MCKEDNQSQAQLPNRNILKLALITRQSVAQFNDIMKAEFASLGLSPSIRLEDYGAMAESDSEGLTEPSMASVVH